MGQTSPGKSPVPYVDHIDHVARRLTFIFLTFGLVGLTACTTTAETTSDTSSSSSPAPSTTSLPAPTNPTTREPASQGQPEGAATPDNPDTANPPIASAPNNPASPTAIAGLDCDSAEVTQSEMNACAQNEYVTTDAELNRVYQAVKANQSDIGKEALESAEVAWIRFRDLDCEFERSQFEGGSIAPLVYSSCLTAQTNLRIDELRKSLLPQSSFQSADGALNQVYQSLSTVLADDRRNRLTDAQLAWIEYRDRNCTFEVSYSPDVIEESQCMARMSELRTAQLRSYLEQNTL